MAFLIFQITPACNSLFVLSLIMLHCINLLVWYRHSFNTIQTHNIILDRIQPQILFYIRLMNCMRRCEAVKSLQALPDNWELPGCTCNSLDHSYPNCLLIWTRLQPKRSSVLPYTLDQAQTALSHRYYFPALSCMSMLAVTEAGCTLNVSRWVGNEKVGQFPLDIPELAHFQIQVIALKSMRVIVKFFYSTEQILQSHDDCTDNEMTYRIACIPPEGMPKYMWKIQDVVCQDWSSEEYLSNNMQIDWSIIKLYNVNDLPIEQHAIRLMKFNRYVWNRDE